MNSTNKFYSEQKAGGFISGLLNLLIKQFFKIDFEQKSKERNKLFITNAKSKPALS